MRQGFGRQGARAVSAPWLALGVALLLGAAACGDGDDKDAKADAAGGDVASDTSVADTASDAVADDTGPGTDATADAATCGALPSCLNSFGQEDLGLCPKPQSDYTCQQGCCVAKKICKADADCAAALGTAECPDTRFICGCDLDTGACVQAMCKTDADCAAGKQCHQGGCTDPLAEPVLGARLLRPYWLGGPGVTFDPALALGAQAVDPKGNVAPDAKFKWTVQTADGSFTLEGGQIKSTTKAGKATVTATVEGSAQPASNPATVWNLGPLPADKNLRVTAIDDLSHAPLAGKAVIVGLADAATPAAALVVDLTGGQASFAGVQFPCDIHVLAADHAPVSVLRYDPGQGPADVVLPTPLRHLAELQFDADGKLVKDKSTLVNADLVTGKIDYPGVGEAALGVTSLSFGPALLNFSIESILGPEVKRPFDKDAPNFVNPDPGKPQDVPGGVTFSLGKPVLTDYVLAGQPGKRILWTLAGKLSLSDLLQEVSKIFEAVEGGLDVGKVVSALLPYLSGLQSQVVFGVEFAPQLTEPLKKLDLAPKFPLGHRLEVTVPTLPELGEAFADVAFVIGGALLPSGEIVPLGLTAGTDKADEKDVADGKVDADVEEPGLQPLALAVAPLHSGLRVGDANHVLVTAAIFLAGKDKDGKAKKEAGSIVLGAPGVVPAEYAPEAFLPVPEGSTYDPATATLTAKTVAGAHFYRATVTGSQAAQWLVLVSGGHADKPLVLPDLTAWGAPTDLGKQTKRVLVGAFELRQAKSFAALVGPGGLDDLVRQVKRTAFVDATP